MRISVIGLGYVGLVCAGAFAKEGHEVIGVDIDQTKVDMVCRQQAPIVEKDLDRYISEGVQSGRLRATTDIEEAVVNSDLSFICVGTPSAPNGAIDLRYILQAAEQIGEALRKKEGFHTIVMRSTVFPGTGEQVIERIERNGKRYKEDFGYVSNPEFLRESTAFEDFYNPPKTVIGCEDERSKQIMRELYGFLDAPYFEVDIKTAEMVKYADNSWHAVKVTFGNEIGMIAKRLGIDSHKVMEIFCADTKLNISPYYLKPGFAFGGSCLPKDVKALTYEAKRHDVEVKLLNSLMPSNRYQIERVFEEFIRPLGRKRIGMLGLSFKANTDDLRHSPLLELAQILIGRGYELKIYDPNVMIAMRNFPKYFDRELPHIKERMVTSLEDLAACEVIVVGNKNEVFLEYAKNCDKHVIDLVRIDERTSGENYQGIAW